MKKGLALLLPLLVLLIIHGCKKDPYAIDISGIELNLELHEFEKDLWSINTDSIWDEIYLLSTNYGDFWDLYTNQVIRVGGDNEADFSDKLLLFLTDPVMYDNYKKSLEVFDNKDQYLKEMEDCFKRYSYYFPHKSIPEIYTFLGGFNHSVITDENILGVGLDKYYGPDCIFYDQLQIPEYAKRKLSPEYMVNDCMQAWAYMELPKLDSTNYLISYMIYEGLIIHFLKHINPGLPDHFYIKYSEMEFDWCLSSEGSMWKYLIDQKMLFDTEYKNMIRYIKDGPFTGAFTQNSPGRAGVWIGYRIVEKYLENNPGVDIKGLFSITDYQEILNMSRYNP